MNPVQTVSTLQGAMCDVCREGRLLGEAVHAADGSWEYFLGCVHCGARKSVTASGVQPLEPAAPPEPHADAPVPTSTGKRGVCPHPGCTTILSIYNRGDRCGTHSGL
jgi:hypothetical protein